MQYYRLGFNVNRSRTKRRLYGLKLTTVHTILQQSMGHFFTLSKMVGSQSGIHLVLGCGSLLTMHYTILEHCKENIIKFNLVHPP